MDHNRVMQILQIGRNESSCRSLDHNVMPIFFTMQLKRRTIIHLILVALLACSSPRLLQMQTNYYVQSSQLSVHLSSRASPRCDQSQQSKSEDSDRLLRYDTVSHKPQYQLPYPCGILFFYHIPSTGKWHLVPYSVKRFHFRWSAADDEKSHCVIVILLGSKARRRWFFSSAWPYWIPGVLPVVDVVYIIFPFIVLRLIIQIITLQVETPLTRGSVDTPRPKEALTIATSSVGNLTFWAKCPNFHPVLSTSRRDSSQAWLATSKI